MERHYLCIDLKSFYASVECVERGLDPMTTNLVVADPTRTEKTICLAVSPSLKEKGVKNRCRVFEIPKNLKYIMAPPRMQKYIDYAMRIYGVYLEYISSEDIHVYSIDEAFLDVTDYLKLYKKTPREMAKFLMDEVYKKVGVRATAGVGTNLYLAKIALDIIAKHAPDFIGELDEKSYREKLWSHRPITDFWRIGKGTAKRLSDHCMFTMGDITKADPEILYKIFGIDAELLIDHAWGREPTTIKDIKNYTAGSTSYSSTQVLHRNYNFDEAALIVREMTRELCLKIVRNHELVSSITLYTGLFRGTHRFLTPTSVDQVITTAADELFHKIADRESVYRRIGISFNDIEKDSAPRQMSLFDNVKRQESNKKIQSAIIDIKSKFGKNAIFRGEDLEDAATTRERNLQIGGHKSGK